MNRPELERAFLGPIKECARWFGFSTWEPNGKISNFNKHEWSIYRQCIITVQQISHLPKAILLISSDEWIDATLLSAGKGTATFQTRKQRYREGNLLGGGYFGRHRRHRACLPGDACPAHSYGGGGGLQEKDNLEMGKLRASPLNLITIFEKFKDKDSI